MATFKVQNPSTDFWARIDRFASKCGVQCTRTGGFVSTVTVTGKPRRVAKFMRRINS